MRVIKISKADWQGLSEGAHLIAFGKKKKPETERIDFTLAVETFAGVLMGYATCRELDSESLYWQYGGAFPGTSNTVHTWRFFQKLLDFCKESGYKRVGFYVENTNIRMLKLAMKADFLITVVRTFEGCVLLEHKKEL